MYPIGYPHGIPQGIHRVAFHTLGSLLASDGLPHPRLCFVLAAHSPSPLSDSPPKTRTHLKMNVSPSYVAPIIPPIRCHRSLQILVLAHTHCVVSQYKSSQRHPSTFTKPSQNDCLIILDTPSIPPIWCHRPTQILALAHTHCVVSQYKSSQRHPSTFTNPSQNDCLIILDTPSIPPISPHRSTQILALAHPFSLPFKYKSSQRHPSQNKNPSQNECFIKRDTPSIPPISPHVP